MSLLFVGPVVGVVGGERDIVVGRVEGFGYVKSFFRSSIIFKTK